MRSGSGQPVKFMIYSLAIPLILLVQLVVQLFGIGTTFNMRDKRTEEKLEAFRQELNSQIRIYKNTEGNDRFQGKREMAMQLKAFFDFLFKKT